jgi:hypothetical protein
MERELKPQGRDIISPLCHERWLVDAEWTLWKQVTSFRITGLRDSIHRVTFYKHNVSKTDLMPYSKWKKEDTLSFGPLEGAEVNRQAFLSPPDYETGVTVSETSCFPVA